MLTLIPVLTVVPIWLCWWWMSRIPSIRWGVTLIMTGLYAGGVVVARIWRGTAFVVVLLTVAMMMATVLTGRAIERRRLGPGPGRRTALPLYVLVGWLLTMACAFVVVLNLPDPYE